MLQAFWLLLYYLVVIFHSLYSYADFHLLPDFNNYKISINDFFLLVKNIGGKCDFKFKMRVFE